MDPAHTGAFCMRMAWNCALCGTLLHSLLFLQSFVETDVAQLHLVFLLKLNETVGGLT